MGTLYTIDSEQIVDIADAVREKLDSEDTYLIEEIPDKIREIKSISDLPFNVVVSEEFEVLADVTTILRTAIPLSADFYNKLVADYLDCGGKSVYSFYIYSEVAPQKSSFVCANEIFKITNYNVNTGLTITYLSTTHRWARYNAYSTDTLEQCEWENYGFVVGATTATSTMANATMKDLGQLTYFCNQTTSLRQGKYTVVIMRNK